MYLVGFGPRGIWEAAGGKGGVFFYNSLEVSWDVTFFATLYTMLLHTRLKVDVDVETNSSNLSLGS